MIDDVFAAISKSWNRMVELLFRPFHLQTYLGFVLLCFFSDCGSMSASSNFSNFDTSNFPSVGDVDPLVGGAVLAVAVAIVAVVVLVSTAIYAGLLFISSRATMMTIDAIQQGQARTLAWELHERAANGLWRFRVGLMLVSTLWVLLVVGIAVGLLGAMGFSGSPAEIVALGQVAVALTLFVAIFPPALLVGVVDWFAKDLAAPVMMVTDTTVIGAFRLLFAAERFDPVSLFLYVLMRVTLAVVVAFAAFPIGLFCCCAFIIPGVRHAVFLPVLLFQRGLSMQWLSTVDPRFASLGTAEAA